MTTMVGLTAGMLTTMAFLPQVVQVVRTRKTRDISLAMYVVFVLGVTCWTVYGYLLGEIPIMIANIVTLLLASIIVVYKIKHG